MILPLINRSLNRWIHFKNINNGIIFFKEPQKIKKKQRDQTLSDSSNGSSHRRNKRAKNGKLISPEKLNKVSTRTKHQRFNVNDLDKVPTTTESDDSDQYEEYDNNEI